VKRRGNGLSYYASPQQCMNNRPRAVILVLCALLLTGISPAFAIADSDTPIVEIHAYWLDSTQSSHDHAWKFTFSSPAEDFVDSASMSIVHRDSGGSIIFDQTVNASNLENLSDDANSLVWRPDSILSFGDQVTIEVYDDGVFITSREVGVTVWNQPLADHEVTISTNWVIDQEYEDEFGPQSYQLYFLGQGWQQRIGDTLVANELGNGTLNITENSENDTMTLELILSSIWRNETTIDGILDRQEFEATGSGNMMLINVEEEAVTTVNASVNDALFSRTYAGGSHSEHIKLEALGKLNVSEELGENNGTWIDGDLSLLLVETIDVDGVRTFSLVQIEATADMKMIDGEQRFDLEVEELIILQRWLDGQRVEEHNKILAHGTFGFADEEENGSVSINGTVIDFRAESLNGLTIQDKLHVDGTIEGEASGTFGIVRDIKESGTWHNGNDTDYSVNVIHQETWFNITAVQGWSNGGDGVGAQNNETWFYTVPEVDWDNRTIYQRWRSSGLGENDEGEEYPEESPIEQEPEAPESEEGLGEANISRETGLAPLSLSPGDQLILDHQEGMILRVNATIASTVNRDGHLLNVTHWTGEYLDTEAGTAAGSIINEGILDGLIAEVIRQAEVETPAGNTVLFNETQTLERVLSPSIVTAAENHDPSIEGAGLRGGLVVNEGGSIAYLEVDVADVDWNIVSVTADLGPLGQGTLILNDVGLLGDSTIHDDEWTGEFTYMGHLHGQVSINVTVIDAFNAEVTEAFNITIFNQAPRLVEFEFTPVQVVRGDAIIVNALVVDGNGVSRVAIDLRDQGGELVELSKEEFGSDWIGMVEIPYEMSPGEHYLRISMVDDDGAMVTVTEMQTLNVHKSAGQETLPDDVIPPLQVLNEGPLFVLVSVDKTPLIRPNIGGDQVKITATISDPDGISTAVIKLGDLSPAGMQDTWLIMNDDGQDGDETANDGVWTYVFETRSGMPLGTFAMTLRATDIYGAWTEDDSLAIQVIEDNGINPGENPSSVFSSSAVVFGLVGILGLIAIVVVTVIIRRTKQEGGMKWDDSDAFGSN
jgi:hypothetical protein